MSGGQGGTDLPGDRGRQPAGPGGQHAQRARGPAAGAGVRAVAARVRCSSRTSTCRASPRAPTSTAGTRIRPGSTWSTPSASWRRRATPRSRHSSSPPAWPRSRRCCSRSCAPGDAVVLPGRLPGAAPLARAQLEAYGIEVRTAPTAGDAQLEVLDGAKLLWIESPSNPGLDVCDIRRLAEAAHARARWWPSTTRSPPRSGSGRWQLGADFSVASGTKALTGHGDILLGYVTARDPELTAAVRRWRKIVGAIPGPMEAWLAHRSIATLQLRVDRQAANALALAEALRGAARGERSAVSRACPTTPRTRSPRGRCGASAAWSPSRCRDQAHAERFLEALRLVDEATSFGGVQLHRGTPRPLGRRRGAGGLRPLLGGRRGPRGPRGGRAAGAGRGGDGDDGGGRFDGTDRRAVARARGVRAAGAARRPGTLSIDRRGHVVLPGLTAADVRHASGPALQPRHPPGGQAHRPRPGPRRRPARADQAHQARHRTVLGHARRRCRGRRRRRRRRAPPRDRRGAGRQDHRRGPGLRRHRRAHRGRRRERREGAVLLRLPAGVDGPRPRHGPEVDDPCGEYEVVRVPFTRLGIASVGSCRCRCGTTWTRTSRASSGCSARTWADPSGRGRCST